MSAYLFTKSVAYLSDFVKACGSFSLTYFEQDKTPPQDTRKNSLFGHIYNVVDHIS